MFRGSLIGWLQEKRTHKIKKSELQKTHFLRRWMFVKSEKKAITLAFFTMFSSLEQFSKNRFTWGGSRGFLEAKMARNLVFYNTFLRFSKCIKEGSHPPLLVPRGFLERPSGAQGNQKTQVSWQPDRGISRKRKTAKNEKTKFKNKHYKLQGSRAQATQGNLKNIIFH